MKTKFEQFNGLYVQGIVAVNADGFIKMYTSKAMLDKAIQKAKSEGYDCKAVRNRNSWAIVLNA